MAWVLSAGEQPPAINTNMLKMIAAMLLSALPVHAANMVTTTDGHGENKTAMEARRICNEE